MARGELTRRSGQLAVFLIVLAGSWSIARALSCRTEATSAGSAVHCSHRRMTRLPKHVPSDIIWLDMSFNFLTSLNFSNNPQLSSLKTLNLSHNFLSNLSIGAVLNTPDLMVLDLSHNPLGTLHDDNLSGVKYLTTLRLSSTELHYVSSASFRSLNHLLSLDLSNNSLSKAPSAALRCVRSLQHLDLSRNHLTTITNDSVNFLSNLQHLSLYSNNLHSLQPGAFTGMEKLLTLDLRFNNFGYEFPCFPDIFLPLVSLEKLSVSGKMYKDTKACPSKVFNPLKSLKLMSIYTRFNPNYQMAFRNLTSLISLTFGPHGGDECLKKAIQNKTFSAFHDSGLQNLTIQGCSLTKVDTCAFCHLPRLRTLTVTDSQYMRVPKLLLALYGLQNQTLEEVTFSRSRYDGATILDKRVMEYANNVCIKRLNAQLCGIVRITADAVNYHGMLLKCLKHVDLSQNALTNKRAVGMLWKLSLALVNIEYFTINTQTIFSLGHKIFRQHHPLKQRNLWDDITLFLPTPPSLKYFNTSSAIRRMAILAKHITLPHGGNITVLDLSYCGALRCDWVVSGLTSVHTLDFSGNNCFFMGDWVFQNMATLRRLVLSEASLSEKFLFSNGTTLFKPLKDLEELDLSHNHLEKLPCDLLQHQLHLKRLILAENRFVDFPPVVSKLNALQELDLSYNMIHILSSSDRQILNTLAAHHPTALHLRGNPLSCSCQALGMISWLGMTTVRLDGHNKNEGFDDDYDDNGRDYPCVLEDGSMSSTWQVIGQWESHWRRCVGLSLFTTSIVALLLQLLALLLTYLLWSNWTYVRHMWYVLRHVRLPRRADFNYDALLVYASDDIQLAVAVKQRLLSLMPGLRVARTEDVIQLGAFYSAEVAECIGKSWKIILLVTQDFMEDDMSGYTVLHAQSCLSDTMPRRVFLLYVGHLTAPQRPGPTNLSMRKLLRMLPESNVYHVPDNVTADPAHPVWQSLVQAVAEQWT